MRKLVLVIGMAMILPFCLQAQKLKTHKVSDGDIIIKVPDNFVEMIPEDIVQRFPSIRRPMAAFTDDSRQSEETVKISATQWGNEDHEIAKDFFKASILELFDKVEFHKEEIVTIKKKKYIMFEFTSLVRSSDTQPSERKYNYLAYYLKDRRTLVISFRCPERERERYQPLAEEIMNKIKIKRF